MAALLAPFFGVAEVLAAADDSAVPGAAVTTTVDPGAVTTAGVVDVSDVAVEAIEDWAADDVVEVSSAVAVEALEATPLSQTLQ